MYSRRSYDHESFIIRSHDHDLMSFSRSYDLSAQQDPKIITNKKYINNCVEYKNKLDFAFFKDNLRDLKCIRVIQN